MRKNPRTYTIYPADAVPPEMLAKWPVKVEIEFEGRDGVYLIFGETFEEVTGIKPLDLRDMSKGGLQKNKGKQLGVKKKQELESDMDAWMDSDRSNRRKGLRLSIAQGKHIQKVKLKKKERLPGDIDV